MAQFSSRTPYSFSAPSIYYGRNMIDDQQINNGYDGTSRLPDIHFQKQLMDKIHTLELENSELREAVGNLRRENGNLRSKLRQESDIRDKREYNRETIEEFSCIEVQTMLEDIGLGDYVPLFAKELIDGSILVDIDDKVLEGELAIHSPTDRQKLLKLTTGEETMKPSTEKRLV